MSHISEKRQYACITGTGRYVPPNRVENREIEERLGEPVSDWLVQNVGIEARHYMSPEQTTSDLATAAATDALADSGVRPGDLDLVIVATDTPDQPSPATAAVVQNKLGADGAAAFDVNCACASWVTAVDIASKSIACDPAVKRAVVVGAYGMSRFVDPTDKKTCTLFADGAAAVVLEARDRPGYLGSRLEADGSFHDALGVYGGGVSRPATTENLRDHGPPRVEFVRRFPPTFNTERWPALIDRVLAPQRMRPGDVDLFLFTQLNLRTIEATMETLGLPMAKTHWTMDRWGYTGSACIPMTLDDAARSGRLRPGDHVLFCATGGGLALAAALFRWGVDG